MPHELIAFFISMVPVIELRGAIPYGAAMGLPLWLNYILCCLGNMVPVPFILLFVRALLSWMKRMPFKFFSHIASFIESKADKHSDEVTKYATFGLMLFVAIPLPGTGAWTGAIIAALMKMRFRYALISICGGVLIAGAILTAGSYGVIGVLKIFL